MKLVILLALCALLGGCAWQPNGWNANVYTDPNIHVQTYSIGISGSIPPFPYYKSPDNK